MFRTLTDQMAPQPGEGDPRCRLRREARSIVCWPAGWARPTQSRAIDTNPFLLREAQALAKADSVDDLICFTYGNAEALPFADASFDCIFSVTVLEECDADSRARRDDARARGRAGASA